MARAISWLPDASSASRRRLPMQTTAIGFPVNEPEARAALGPIPREEFLHGVGTA